MEAPVNMILQIQETPASALTVKKLEGLLGATTKDKLRSVITVAQVVFVGCLAYYAGRKLSQIMAKKKARVMFKARCMASPEFEGVSPDAMDSLFEEFYCEYSLNKEGGRI